MALLGVDVGGSKTLAVVVDRAGRCLGVGAAGGGNFQVSGRDEARLQVSRSVGAALVEARLRRENLRAAYLGVAGADREDDFRIVASMLEPVFSGMRWGFENDATIGLWAATGAGVGVAVVCGSGTNVIGFDGRGRRVQVGGMGWLFGDAAGGSHIGSLAVRAAMRGRQGRGESTVLYDEICRHYGVDDVLDLTDRLYRGEDLRLSELTPLVFGAAAQGDGPARNILTEVGQELGASANAALRRLFPHLGEEALPVPVVAMGSVFQRARHPLLYDAFVAALKQEHPSAQPGILHCEPVFGAVYAAARDAGVSVDADFRRRLEQSFPGRPLV